MIARTLAFKSKRIQMQQPRFPAANMPKTVNHATVTRIKPQIKHFAVVERQPTWSKSKVSTSSLKTPSHETTTTKPASLGHLEQSSALGSSNKSLLVAGTLCIGTGILIFAGGQLIINVKAAWSTSTVGCIFIGMGICVFALLGLFTCIISTQARLRRRRVSAMSAADSVQRLSTANSLDVMTSNALTVGNLRLFRNSHRV